jgi:molecular chaperone DnaK (HSP70)
MREIIFGIDLGTTNSSIACLKDGKAEALSIEEGQALVYSMRKTFADRIYDRLGRDLIKT